MTRLSIIDIAGGHQPMWTDDRTVGIVYNGELYNYREIDAELAQAGRPPRSSSDTDTIVRLYEAQGRDDPARNAAPPPWDVRPSASMTINVVS